MTSDSGFDLGLTPGFEIGETELATDNGGWMRGPVESLGLAGADGNVFFGQFTVPADAPPLTGVANFTVRYHETVDESYAFFGVGFSDDGAEAIPVTADTNGDLQIDVDDIVDIIANWGSCGSCPAECDECFCSADVNADGQVNGTDLVCVIEQFGTM